MCEFVVRRSSKPTHNVIITNAARSAPNERAVTANCSAYLSIGMCLLDKTKVVGDVYNAPPAKNNGWTAADGNAHHALN
jgi:hypothetical protein